MKVLILTVTAGYGHNATAHAIAEGLNKLCVETTVKDIYQYAGKIMYMTVDKGYNFSAKYLRRVYESTYSRLENGEFANFFAELLSAKSLLVRKFEDYFKKNSFDAVVCTHIFAALMVNQMKKRNKLFLPVIGICTDYCLHPFWEKVSEIEYIVTASRLLDYIAVKRGINTSRLLPFGLPISDKFRHDLDKKTAKKQLELDPERRVILVLGGSMGYGKMMASVSKVDDMDIDAQVVCICGRNQKLYKKMRLLKTRSKLHVHGFVDNMEVFMDAADCIVTKPGGLTTTEALAKRKPMILVNPIPGQEERNLEFLLNNGAAVRVSESFSLPEAVLYLFADTRRLEIMESSADLIAHPDATERLCEFVAALGDERA